MRLAPTSFYAEDQQPQLRLRGGWLTPGAAVRAVPPRLLLLCLLLRSSWLTVEGGRQTRAAGVLHRRGGRAAFGRVGQRGLVASPLATLVARVPSSRVDAVVSRRPRDGSSSVVRPIMLRVRLGRRAYSAPGICIARVAEHNRLPATRRRGFRVPEFRWTESQARREAQGNWPRPIRWETADWRRACDARSPSCPELATRHLTSNSAGSSRSDYVGRAHTISRPARGREVSDLATAHNRTHNRRAIMSSTT
jgi:hypothetical protein